MFESSMQVVLTDYAMKRSGKLHGAFWRCGLTLDVETDTYMAAEHEPKMWDDLKAQFMNHLPEINADLKAAGLPELGKK